MMEPPALRVPGLGFGRWRFLQGLRFGNVRAYCRTVAQDSEEPKEGTSTPDLEP